VGLHQRVAHGVVFFFFFVSPNGYHRAGNGPAVMENPITAHLNPTSGQTGGDAGFRAGGDKPVLSSAC
jgi:hypothetical protein